MKKTLSITAIIAASFAFGQCNIVGSSNIGVGKSEVYTVDTAGQCTECHHWANSTDNVKFDTNIKQKQIKIKGLKEGQNTLYISVMTSKGIEQCSKIIDVLSTAKPNYNSEFEENPIAQNVPCEINITDFKEIMINDQTIAFALNNSPQNYQYLWIVEYANGDKKEFIENMPQIPIIKDNDITSVKVKIQSAYCYKQLTRTYPLYYWSPPAEQRIPQRIYEQISYSDYSKQN